MATRHELGDCMILVKGLECQYCGYKWNGLMPARTIGIQCPECRIYDPVAPIPGNSATDGTSLPHVTRQPYQIEVLRSQDII